VDRENFVPEMKYGDPQLSKMNTGRFVLDLQAVRSRKGNIKYFDVLLK